MRIVIVGGGIAGIEAALTLSRTLMDAQISLVTEQTRMRVLPNLVRVPFGDAPRRTSIDLLDVLHGTGVRIERDRARFVFPDRHTLWLASGRSLDYDVLVAAPGAQSAPSSGHGLRSLGDAMMLRDALATLAERGGRLVVRELPNADWRPSAAEFALCATAWARTLDSEVRITMLTDSATVADELGYEVSEIVEGELGARGVELVTHVQPARFDHVDADVLADVTPMIANALPGLPPVNPDGWYRTDPTGMVCPDHYVVGDASDIPIRSAYAVGWHARRVARALGGDLTLLGDEIDGIPVTDVQYEMDLGDGRSLRARANADHHLAASGISHWQHVSVVNAPAVKLRGTLVRTAMAIGSPAMKPPTRIVS